MISDGGPKKTRAKDWEYEAKRAIDRTITEEVSARAAPQTLRLRLASWHCLAFPPLDRRKLDSRSRVFGGQDG